MSFIRVPGFGGIYVVDTMSGEVSRIGREGGVRHPITNQLNSGMRFDELGGQVGTAALQALQAYGGQSSGGGGGGGGGESGGGGFEGSSGQGPGFEMSPEEKRLLELQIRSIEKSTAQQDEIFARENSRRAAYNRWVQGERWTPSDMEQEQGQLAARSAHISGIEQERLEKALEGKLPVSLSTEREISEGQTLLNERLRRNLGQAGYQTSEAGAKELARSDESAGILREADRKGYIERGIQPSISAAQFAQQAVGQYVPTEVPGLGAALQGLQNSRFNEGRLALGYAGLEGAGEGGGEAGVDSAFQRRMEEDAYRYMRNQASNKGSGGFFGSGFGKLVGSLVGGAAGYYVSGLGETKKSNASGAQSFY
jgi:hypothetical protein